MKINSAGLKLVKSFEGCQLKAYKCPAGVWTIGYGHTGSVNGKAIGEGMKITQAKADSLLKADMSAFEKKVEKYNSKYHFNENQFSALVSFAFNVGSIDQLTAHGTRTIKQISEKILLYNKAAGRTLNGLTRRRKAEQELFNKAVKAKAKSTGTVYKVTAGALNVRKGAGMQYSKVDLLKRGEKVTVTKTKGGWGYIGSGWISLKYAKVV